MLDKMKELFAMQRKMSEIKKKLEGANFEIASSDGLVKITMNGAQEVQEVNLKENIAETDRIGLEKALKETFNKAVKRSQEIAAQEMKDTIGFNMPGL